MTAFFFQLSFFQGNHCDFVLPRELSDIDFIDDYILKVTPEHPDEWDVDEDCVGEIEDFRNLAERKQEEEEIRWEEAVNNPDHPDHKAEWDKLNE